MNFKRKNRGSINDKGLIKRPELSTSANCRLYAGLAVLGEPLYSLECLMPKQSRIHRNYKTILPYYNGIKREVLI